MSDAATLAARSMIEVGRRLHALRSALGLKAKDICAQVNVEPNTWSQWENGRRMADLNAMMRVYDLFGADLNFIYMGSTSSMPHELALRVREQLSRTAPPPDAEIAAMLKRRGLSHPGIDEVDSREAAKVAGGK
jgi:transcriptional regulator with XRE-family HTH domain